MLNTIQLDDRRSVRAGETTLTADPGSQTGFDSDRPSRVSISKRTRFEVFKRDKFRCVYCGQTPPSVVLEIDHVIPVAAGGTNDEANLVTSCFDCNHGKSDKPLDRMPIGHEETLEERREKLSQLKAISDFVLEQRREEDRLIALVEDHWMKFEEPRHKFTQLARATIRRFLHQLPLNEILDAVEIAFTNGYNSYRFRYFCGVIWKKIAKLNDFKSAAQK